MNQQTSSGSWSQDRTQSEDDQTQIDSVQPRYISLGTCDNTFFWLSGFRRKFVHDKLNSPPPGIPGELFNDPFSHGTHYCLWVHRHAKADYTNTCKIYGTPIIQPSADGKASIFDSIYWPRCDGTYRNAFEDKLLTTNGQDRLHTLLKVRLRDVVIPETKGQSATGRIRPLSRAGDVQEREMERIRGIETYEKFKDAFVIRFL